MITASDIRQHIAEERENKNILEKWLDKNKKNIPFQVKTAVYSEINSIESRIRFLEKKLGEKQKEV